MTCPGTEDGVAYAGCEEGKGALRVGEGGEAEDVLLRE